MIEIKAKTTMFVVLTYTTAAQLQPYGSAHQTARRPTAWVKWRPIWRNKAIKYVYVYCLADVVDHIAYGCDETPHRIHRTHWSLNYIMGRVPLPRLHPGWARLNCLTNTDPNLLPSPLYTESCPVTALFGLRCVRCIRCGVSSHRPPEPVMRTVEAITLYIFTWCVKPGHSAVWMISFLTGLHRSTLTYLLTYLLLCISV